VKVKSGTANTAAGTNVFLKNDQQIEVFADEESGHYKLTDGSVSVYMAAVHVFCMTFGYTSLTIIDVLAGICS
jgi:hypothetical protein